MRSMRNTASSSLATFKRFLASSWRAGGMRTPASGGPKGAVWNILVGARTIARAVIESPFAFGWPDAVSVQPGVHRRGAVGRHRPVAAPALLPAQLLAVMIAQRDDQLAAA